MEIAKLSKKNHYEHITEQLQNLIVEGKLQPGDRLPSTKELSERFGVGRSTMREALSALKAMGLIEIRQGGPSTVSRLPGADKVDIPGLHQLITNRDELLELLEARKSLEVSNAGLAALKRSVPDLESFARILEEMAAHIGDEETGERTDLLFHSALARSTHNGIMEGIFDTISSRMELAIRETRRIELYSNASVSERLYREHLAIFEAIRSGHPDAAQDRMKEHLHHVEGILMKYLQKG
ncbi:FadR/GntR family transcriptional regulator [Paenibacillus aurantius]|uniref:FadR/GntR family transcriptional regulator n=1 Tax=Paenibacillus aurantius TaxID=2918900 RepID=A0AA96LJS1_9BACL|nr:FadR/GntR family transcriptional regulator [Paenibacillus aurantius]WNQ13396.1 FadR/GntR family transcriptional regulator [Paenibacillus aurantius]